MACPLEGQLPTIPGGLLRVNPMRHKSSGQKIREQGETKKKKRHWKWCKIFLLICPLFQGAHRWTSLKWNFLAPWKIYPRPSSVSMTFWEVGDEVRPENTRKWSIYLNLISVPTEWRSTTCWVKKEGCPFPKRLTLFWIASADWNFPRIPLQLEVPWTLLRALMSYDKPVLSYPCGDGQTSGAAFPPPCLVIWSCWWKEGAWKRNVPTHLRVPALQIWENMAMKWLLNSIIPLSV